MLLWSKLLLAHTCPILYLWQLELSGFASLFSVLQLESQVPMRTQTWSVLFIAVMCST